MAAQTPALPMRAAAAPRSQWRRSSAILLRSWDARVCLLFLVLLLVLALLPSSVWPDSVRMTNLRDRLQSPSITGGDSRYLFGSDSLGRDVLMRVLSSTRLTLFIAGLATLISTIAGTAAGLVAGYFGGKIDMIVSRIMDIFLAFPSLLLVLALISSIGQSSWAVIGVLALAGWAGYARVIRSATLGLSQREFIEAARSIGASNGAIVVRHLLPNVVTPMLVLSTLNLASFVLTESAISYLGLGPAPPEFTWGGLIGDGRQNIYEAWWIAFFPGLAIVLTVLSFSFLGDSLRDAFDPTARRQGASAGKGDA
jgi:peptide/nickel transport system permease protein